MIIIHNSVNVICSTDEVLDIRHAEPLAMAKL